MLLTSLFCDGCHHPLANQQGSPGNANRLNHTDNVCPNSLGLEKGRVVPAHFMDVCLIVGYATHVTRC